MEKQMQVDNVERRESYPRLTREQAEEYVAAEREAVRQDVIRNHLNAACNAIKAVPLELVTPEYIDSVLRSLSCRAMEAQLPELSEAIECFADEVEA
jgi:hypothetical protein